MAQPMYYANNKYGSEIGDVMNGTANMLNSLQLFVFLFCGIFSF